MIPTTIRRTCLPALVRRFPPERVKSNFVWRLFHHTCHAKDIQPLAWWIIRRRLGDGRPETVENWGVPV